MAHARQRKALQAVHTRAAAVAAAAAAIATSECFTAEWVNQLLRAVWPTSLEPKIAAKLSASLDVSSFPIPARPEVLRETPVQKGRHV